MGDATVFWLSGSREEGISEARRAVELDGQSAEAHHNLGAMLQMARQLEDAA
jgi:Flp pilus assembly protein TadD